jgi:hypothetical protein
MKAGRSMTNRAKTASTENASTVTSANGKSKAGCRKDSTRRFLLRTIEDIQRGKDYGKTNDVTELGCSDLFSVDPQEPFWDIPGSDRWRLAMSPMWACGERRIFRANFKINRVSMAFMRLLNVEI